MPTAQPLLRPTLIELSAATAAARFSLALEWLLAAQQDGAPAAWIQPAEARLYPPDLQRNGVDLAALLVVQVPPRSAQLGALRAAEMLLRSGAFGLVVLDFLDGVPPHPAAWQGRLLGLLRRHHATVLALTQNTASADSLGPLCSLRLQPRRQGQRGAFAVDVAVLKDKMPRDGLPAKLLCQGPPGL